MNLAPDRAAWTLLVVLPIVSTPRMAMAFCRTHTCQADDSCEYDAENCPVGGLPLVWPRRCISYSVQEDGSPRRHISPRDAEEVLSEAYSTWTESLCQGVHPSIEVQQLARVSCERVEFNECDRNANVWVFRDQEWPYDDGGVTLAQTWVHFDTRSGKIYDSDVEVNTAEFGITTSDEVGRSQFIAIATHEIGHVFGLDHSPNPNATMFAAYRRTTDISKLSQDDVAGLCTIYPAERDVGACDPRPHNGFSAECGSATCEDSGCCATTPGSGHGNSAWAVLAGGLGWALWRGRRTGRGGRK